MSNTLPDCMMPDGAEPCKGWTELYIENQRLLAEIERLWAMLERREQVKNYISAESK